MLPASDSGVENVRVRSNSGVTNHLMDELPLTGIHVRHETLEF